MESVWYLGSHQKRFLSLYKIDFMSYLMPSMHFKDQHSKIKKMDIFKTFVIFCRNNCKYWTHCRHRTGSIEPVLTPTALPEWLERDLLTIPYIIVCIKTLHSGFSDSRERLWLEHSLSNYEKQIFYFFKPIVHFYINVAALSTFQRHVPACQTPVRVSAYSILTALW